MVSPPFPPVRAQRGDFGGGDTLRCLIQLVKMPHFENCGGGGGGGGGGEGGMGGGGG